MNNRTGSDLFVWVREIFEWEEGKPLPRGVGLYGKSLYIAAPAELVQIVQKLNDELYALREKVLGQSRLAPWLRDLLCKHFGHRKERFQSSIGRDIFLCSRCAIQLFDQE